MSIPFSPQRPLRVAVVGAGPAGFYTAETLLKQDIPVKVDLFEKLPAPFGLVRYGVSPDHQKIKNVIKIFEQTASDNRFSYFGNVNIGHDISVSGLKEFYDTIIFCTGAQTDRPLGIKGEDLIGNYKASQFIGWYNGHPRFKDCQFDLSNKVALIMGQGNVAIDIARILCCTKEELAHTDICQHALDALAESKIEQVHVYGRRSAFYAAFTPAEIKEMAQLADCSPFVDPKDLELDPVSAKELESPANALRQKNFSILKSFTSFPYVSRQKRFVLHFNRTPVEILGGAKVEKVRFEINKEGHGIGQYEEIGCGAFFTSIGYVGEPIEGVPFLYQKGIIPNHQGRILEGEQVIGGFYVCGWIASGASGVIGTNKLRAQETVHSLLEDLKDLPVCKNTDTQDLLSLLKERGIIPVTFIDWKKIDAYEIMMGLSIGKPREKMTKVSEMISITKKKY
ncbi:MAG: FAD-dependent oxidoreductase [Candidatus Omnitrophica bacterium]|nr:FAD-dependent oxidoreductase [Candidatus Omnitrophota bacterium]